jgi:hypothetical protein
MAIGCRSMSAMVGNDDRAIACAFDLLMLNGDDLRKLPFTERKALLQKVLHRTSGGIQYVAHIEGDGAEMFEAVCRVGLEGMGFEETEFAPSLRPVEELDQGQKSKAPAATRAQDGTF